MKFEEVLAGKSQIRIKEYEPYVDGLIFVGGAFYDGRRILPLDGKFYPLEMNLRVAEWEDDKTLMIMR